MESSLDEFDRWSDRIDDLLVEYDKRSTNDHWNRDPGTCECRKNARATSLRCTSRTCGSGRNRTRHFGHRRGRSKSKLTQAPNHEFNRSTDQQLERAKHVCSDTDCGDQE